MRRQFSKIALLAGITLALSFTFSCSSDDGGGSSGGDGSSSSVADGSSSSNKGGSSSSVGSSSGGISSSSGDVGSSSPSSTGGGDSVNSGTSSSSAGSVSSGSTGGTVYEVVIGGKTWMKKNLDTPVTGSKCYGEGGQVYDPETSDYVTLSSAEIQANCDKYGRLYDWSTAMALPSKCNSTLSTSDADCAITTPYHKGICPTGWHIPSDAEWDALMTAVRGSSTAGKHLRAEEGWNNCGPSDSGKDYLCEDTHGFSALPGGIGYSAGSFNGVGNLGSWWSASENDSHYAYNRDMYYFSEETYNYLRKDLLFSVRCLQDSP